MRPFDDDVQVAGRVPRMEHFGLPADSQQRLNLVRADAGRASPRE
jgi:hypothetical protein